MESDFTWAKTALNRWGVTHPAAFLRVAPASFAAVQACTWFIKLCTLQKIKRERDYKKCNGSLRCVVRADILGRKNKVSRCVSLSLLLSTTLHHVIVKIPQWIEENEQLKRERTAAKVHSETQVTPWVMWRWIETVASARLWHIYSTWKISCAAVPFKNPFLNGFKKGFRKGSDPVKAD